jgi:hypothetical protein
LLAAGILVALPAFAAQVRVVPDEKSSKGAVMVSHGKGYAPVSGPTVADTGDSVIAFAGGHAKVIYPDGCTVDVNDRGTVVVVSKTSPCKVGLALPTVSTGTYVVGAVIVGGAIAAVSLSGGDGGGGGGNNGGNDHEPRPRSP